MGKQGGANNERQNPPSPPIHPADIQPVNRLRSDGKVMRVDLDGRPVGHVDECDAADQEQRAGNKGWRPAQPQPSGKSSKSESDDSEREILTSWQIAHHGTSLTLLDYSQTAPPSIRRSPRHR